MILQRCSTHGTAHPILFVCIHILRTSPESSTETPQMCRSVVWSSSKHTSVVKSRLFRIDSQQKCEKEFWSSTQAQMRDENSQSMRRERHCSCAELLWSRRLQAEVMTYHDRQMASDV